MDTSIPSSSAIQAAKEKRDRLRKTGGTDEDFISLSVTRRADQDQGPHPSSRLVREDDELGEGDDGTWTILATQANSSRHVLRICSIYKRAGAHCSWTKIEEGRSRKAEN